jgi:hypothetical protein
MVNQSRMLEVEAAKVRTDCFNWLGAVELTVKGFPNGLGYERVMRDNILGAIENVRALIERGPLQVVNKFYWKDRCVELGTIATKQYREKCGEVSAKPGVRHSDNAYESFRAKTLPQRCLQPNWRGTKKMRAEVCELYQAPPSCHE